MLYNADYIDTTLMEKLDVVQKVALYEPQDTCGCFYGSCVNQFDSQINQDSRTREYRLTDESKHSLQQLAALLPSLSNSADWQNMFGPMPINSFIIGQDQIEHAVDIDAELLTAAFVERHTIQSLFPDHYKDINELLK